MMKAPRHHSKSGFSLVELSLAIGIIAFALIPIMALIPLGLNAASEAIEQTSIAQIVRQIRGDLEKLDFETLPGYIAAEQRFTREGEPASSDDEAVYRVTLTAASGSYPGASANIEQQLQRVIVQVRHTKHAAVLYRTSISVINQGSQ